MALVRKTEEVIHSLLPTDYKTEAQQDSQMPPITISRGARRAMPPTMAIQVVEFSNGVYKVRNIFA